MNEKMQFDVSVWMFIKLILVLITFYLLFLVRDILALIFIVLILVATFSPVIKKWAKKIGRIPSVIALFLIIIVVLALVVYMLIPPITDQITQLINNAPSYLEKINLLRSYAPTLQESLPTISSSTGSITQGFVTVTAGVFGGIITFLTAIVLFIYMLVDEQVLKNFVYSLTPTDRKEQIAEILRKIADKVGDWFRGQMILGLIIGVLDLVGLLIIGVPYALTLAVIAGILEIIPTIGPIIAGVLAALVAFTDSPIKALIVVIFFIAIQQLENSIIVPKVMQKAVGLSPVIIIIAILVGAKLLGVAGAILAIPIAASISVIIHEMPILRKVIEKKSGKYEENI